MSAALKTREIAVNEERRLFVIPAGDGLTTYGFDNCFRDAKELSRRLGAADLEPHEAEIGTLKQYGQYRELIGRASTVDLGTWFTPGTPPEVQAILENARRTGQKLRMELGDPATGQRWGDDAQVGLIGRSTGTLKIPLLLASSRSTGGEGLMPDCIVRIEDPANGRLLWKHPTYSPAAPEPTAPGPRR